MKMTQKQQVHHENSHSVRILALVTLLVGVSGVSACSSVPDSLNPAEWYNSTVDFFAGEDEDGQLVQNKSVPDEVKENPGEGKSFPNLASFPERPKRTAQGGLVADTTKRKYAGAVARQGEAASTLTASKTPPQQPAPPAMPVPSVVAVQPPLTPSVPVAAPAAPVMPMTAPSPAPRIAGLTPPSGMPAYSMASLSDDPFATVIVSSSGVEMQGAAQAMAPQQPQATPPMQQLAAAPSPTMNSVEASLRRPIAPMVGGQHVATILFANGSYGLTGRDRQILTEIVSLHRQRGGKVRIVGHASSRTRNMDPVRHKMVNYKVSVDRAQIIGKQLMRLGLASANVVVDARSDTAPLYYESMPSGEAGNRRAEIYFVN